MRKWRLKEPVCSILSIVSGLSNPTAVTNFHKEKCLVSQSCSQDFLGPCISRSLCSSLSAFFLFQHHSYPLRLCLAFPKHLLTSYKLGQIWFLWLNSLHCPATFILFLFCFSCFVLTWFGFFWTFSFYWFYLLLVTRSKLSSSNRNPWAPRVSLLV